ncbi:hypothetical protein RclHR1_11930013 [Rhizophagus clarus]|uniref:3CxxC-type domain-containing protein n=1 Tax=Rhizophagus clarus TaxID=94130 RepID=A0A2Z6Q5P4_9GLOM|nr:hypothetical protein RclHR1_11930013 [Rhizophagus clarus]GES87705.1 hypothetical protein GLOIN_2v1470518 [Rhizophagus clarus]
MCRCQQKHNQKCVDIWLNKNKWQCQHYQKCETERICKKDYLCSYECKNEEYTQELLKEYLKITSSKQQSEFFRKTCKECEKILQISSFHFEDENKGNNTSSLASISVNFYSTSPAETSAEVSSQIPTVKIISHLVWNNYYRVSGKWMCDNCHRIWPSAYTWIKLSSFINETLAENLNQTDFYMQLCKKCKLPENRLLKYEHLKEGESSSHKEHLCKKCSSQRCHRSGVFLD